MELTHHELALLAGRSYRGPQSGRLFDVQYDLIQRGNSIAVVIPGTHPRDAWNWIRDFRVWPRSFGDIGICHAGFGAGAMALWARLKAAGDLPSGRQIVYTGHSLGGAIAQVLAALHASENRDPCRVVTFGAPRVPCRFNFRFGYLVRSASEAVEYRRIGDPVPDTPFLLYGHPTMGKLIGTALLRLIANHDISRYVEDLKDQDVAVAA